MGRVGHGAMMTVQPKGGGVPETRFNVVHYGAAEMKFRIQEIVSPTCLTNKCVI